MKTTSWHEHHEAAANEIEGLLAGRAKTIVAASAWVEAYTVLTRSTTRSQ